MLKKLIVLVASAVFSLSASAAYVKYTFSDGGVVSGFFVQNQKDLSIADYFIEISSPRIDMNFQPSGGIYGGLLWAIARYNNQGPTRFGVFDDRSEAYEETLEFNFSATATPGTYSYLAVFDAVQDESWPIDPWVPRLQPIVHYLRGTVTESAIDAQYAAILDQGYSGLDHIAPPLNPVPEPTSLWLLAIGAAGLAVRAKKRT